MVSRHSKAAVRLSSLQYVRDGRVQHDPSTPTQHDIKDQRRYRYCCFCARVSARITWAAKGIFASATAGGLICVHICIRRLRAHYHTPGRSAAHDWPRGTASCAPCRRFLVGIILGHHVLALWEDDKFPFPLSPTVAAAEILALMCYTSHVMLNFMAFGVAQYR